MTKKPKSSAVYVWDMLYEIEFVERALTKGNLFDEFISRAVLRAFTVLGEAAKRVDNETRAKSPTIPWQKIVDTRNFVSHEYEEINLNKILKIIDDDFPQLKSNLLELYKILTGTDYAN